MLYRGPGEVQGLSPKPLFFFVSPRSSLTRQSCLCLRPQTETIFKLSFISRYLPAILQERRSVFNTVHFHPNLVVLTCLPHFLIFDFRHSDLFHGAHCWSKWSFSPPLLPLFPMTIKGQKYASWPPHLPCIFSIHSHSPSFQQLTHPHLPPLSSLLNITPGDCLPTTTTCTNGHLNPHLF